MSIEKKKSIQIFAVVAIAFGLFTIKAGGSVALSSRPLPDYIVPFVVWFNFLAGFAYVVAGIGLWLQKQWSVWLAIAIATATLIVFAILGIYIARGGAYQSTTIVIMSIRSSLWVLIGIFAKRQGCNQDI